MPEIQDDKAQYVIPFILERLERHQKSPRPRSWPTSSSLPPPFFIGLNGVQGAGKTVLVSILKQTLRSPPHNLSVAVFSLDDFYLTHADQQALAQANPHNPLLQHRGQPSTHDITLALAVFKSLKQNKETRIPVYDKSAFNGQGDRVLPESQWETVNADPAHPVRVVLFEGWCVGFRPLSSEKLREKWQAARDWAHRSSDGDACGETTPYKGRLGHNTLESVTTINEALRKYDQITDQLDAFVHIDAADPLYVYRWRLEQEHALREQKGSGMSDDEVKKFVDGYYPAYELYTDTLRQGVFAGQGPERKGAQMRLVVDQDRKVKEVFRI